MGRGRIGKPRAQMEEEDPLSGGRVTPGVVRVGDTVRRPLGSNSVFRHQLLRHLETVGFPHAPRLLGIDSQGREILTYAEGWVPEDLGTFTVSQLRAAAELIATFHGATALSPLAGHQELVCHGDLSPCNFVFRSGLPVSIIDFDACHPGPRRLDVGYAAWTWLDIGNPTNEAFEVGQRLACFLDSYGPLAPADPLQAIRDAQAWLAERCRVRPQPTSFEIATERWACHCRAWVLEHQSPLREGLDRPDVGRAGP